MSSSNHAGSSPSLWNTLVGLAFASAGIAKLIPLESEEALFRSWGWSRRDMQTIGAAELLGAAMPWRSSVCILTTELRHGNDALVTPRMGLLAAAISGFLSR
jgi:hypothetical protein